MSFLDNLRHHLSIAREAYREEKEAKSMAADQRSKRREELAFMPAALEITETPASPIGRAISISICVFFVIAIAWGLIGKIDIIATASGKIITTERVNIIQPFETGVVRAIHVADGSTVKRGDILIELDPTGAAADRERLTQELLAKQVEIARLTALLEPDPLKAYLPPDNASAAQKSQHRSYLLSELEQHKSRRAALQGDIRKTEAELGTLKADVVRAEKKADRISERVEASRALFDKGILAKMKFSEEEQTLDEAKGELDVARKRLIETRAALTSAKAQLAASEAEFTRDVHMRLSEARQHATSIEQELIKANERNRQQTLTAPVDGTIQQLDVHTVGGVVTPAQPLMQIVPADAELEIEAMVLNKDIGFVREGQEATLKIESFPFTKYGTIDGKVRQVYKDAVENEQTGLTYPARVTMARTVMNVDGTKVNLTPGMNVTVEVKTGKRRVIDYVLAPLQRYQSESLREQ
ncbi:MAG: HlyD family type I secretion periplasmic adaptor subunit [Rhodospirillales bacterium]